MMKTRFLFPVFCSLWLLWGLTSSCSSPTAGTVSCAVTFDSRGADTAADRESIIVGGAEDSDIGTGAANTAAIIIAEDELVEARQSMLRADRLKAGGTRMIARAPSLQDAVAGLFGGDCRVESRRRVGGGDINDAASLELSGGRSLFLKENRSGLEGMFAAEAAGLEALDEVARRSGAPPVPAPLAWGSDGRRSFLLLEEVEKGRLDSGAAFGRALAELHREGRSESCGFDGDNWIGSTPQPNGRMDGWHDFFAERRLGFQWKLARDKGYGDASADRAMESLLRRLPELLPRVDDGRPSLIHGDLWGGNWMAGADGRGWLIDPAVYYGHREADLAMTELFGGFPGGFREGYREAWPLEPGFAERKDLYNLYHVLNHVNLFGGGYWGGVRSTLSRFG